MVEAEAMTGVAIERIDADKGYRGHDYDGEAKVMLSGHKRDLTPIMRRELKRRTAIGPMIGHAKNDGRLGRKWLSNRVFKSYEDILDHCCYAWNSLIEQPWKITSIGTRQWANE